MRQSLARLVIFHTGHSVCYSSVKSPWPIILRPSALLEFSTSPSSKYLLDLRMKHSQTPKAVFVKVTESVLYSLQASFQGSYHIT